MTGNSRIKLKKRLGQNLMVCRNVARKEASFAKGRNAIELGAGAGALTRELCSAAKSVFAVELDSRLFKLLKETLREQNLRLANADFFSLDPKTLEGYDILVSNVPYNLSSRLLLWLAARRIEAVLCLQKEIVERMLAKPSTKSYSRLSVFSSLMFKVEKTMDVPRGCFFPVPGVDSCVIHIKRSGSDVGREEMAVLTLLMEHKRKELRNAVIDSRKQLAISKEEAAKLAGGLEDRYERVFKMGPERLLAAAREIGKRTKGREC